jgi:hypothetical protein
MVENRRLRFDRSQVSPQNLPEAVEKATGGRALRWFVGQVTARELVVEATVASEAIGEFRDSAAARFYPGSSVAVSIVPTGIGCSIGGYAGDAAPATRLLASTVDYLVTNPNAVNASDFLQLDDNVLYTEGYCIDLLCRGRIDLHIPYANSIGVIVERSSDSRLDVAFNVINTVRAVHGVDIEHCIVTDRPIGSRCERNASGAFVGSLDHPEVLASACDSLLANGVDAIAVASNVQDLPFDDYALHFAGRAPNPVGGVEAVISHFIVNRFRVPAAHAPLLNVKELALESPIVDARGAGEFSSRSGLACVLMGLARAPQIAPRAGMRYRDVVNLNNIVAIVAPATCLGGIPTLFAARFRIPVIAVRDNETILRVTGRGLGLDNVIEVGSYAEAAGVVLARERGIALPSLARPLATLRHPARAAAAPRAVEAVPVPAGEAAPPPGAWPGFGSKGRDGMRLTDEQLEIYRRDGFLFLPECFSRQEVELMKAQLPALFAEDSERRVLEKGGGSVRSVYGSHETNEVFHRLVRQPRLLAPAMQILGSPVYVYQFKINAKNAFVGDVWEWHQDYVFWQREDGVPEPRLVTFSVFLDEVHDFNGPLMLVPGSHREGVIEPPRTGGVPQGYEERPDWIANLTASLKYSVDRGALERVVSAGGIVAPKGPAGSVLFFHPDLVHGSVPNMSPFDRKLLLVTYNSVDNCQTVIENARPAFLVGRNFEPLSPLADPGLLAAPSPERLGVAS